MILNPMNCSKYVPSNSQDLLNRIIDVGHPRHLCHGTNNTIARKNWDDIKIRDHLNTLWDNAGLSKRSFEVNKH